MWRFMRRPSDMIEALAIGATVACLVHCLALPLLIAAIPVLATVMPLPGNFHVVALLLAVPATAGALFAGYRRHRLARPLVAGTLGLTLLAVAALAWHATPLEVPMTVVGSLLIAAAHLANWRYRREAHLKVA
jgi:hypothetical protein